MLTRKITDVNIHICSSYSLIVLIKAIITQNSLTCSSILTEFKTETLFLSLSPTFPISMICMLVLQNDDTWPPSSKRLENH